jgi:hypothetical protein
VKIPFPIDVTSTFRPMCTDTARGIECFAVDSRRNLWTIQPSSGASSDDWRQLATAIAEPPHCLASGTKLDCFSRSIGNRLISASFDGKTWSQWLEVGPATVQSQPYCNKLGSGFDCYWTSPDFELRRLQKDHGVWLA